MESSRKIKFTQAVDAIGEYFFSEKLKEVRGLIAKGRPVINLGIGNPDQPPPPEAIDVMVQEAKKGSSHGYQPYQGIPEFRTAVAEWYWKEFRVELNPDKEVYPLIGSKEGIQYINQSLAEKGDQVVIPNPGYPTYKNIAKILGLKTYEYDPSRILKEEDSRLLSEIKKSKVFWTNFPNMPTGRNLSDKEYEAFAKFLSDSDAVVVNDNPYSHYCAKSPRSLLQYLNKDKGVVELGSLSKSFHMAGWRIGYIVGHADVVGAVAKLKSHVDTGIFLPIQKGAVTALQLNNDWIKERDEVLLRRRKLGEEILRRVGAKNVENQVGMFVWGEGIENADQLVNDLLEKKDIFIVPGHVFGSNGKNCVRISLCVSEEKLKECLERLK